MPLKLSIYKNATIFPMQVKNTLRFLPYFFISLFILLTITTFYPHTPLLYYSTLAIQTVFIVLYFYAKRIEKEPEKQHILIALIFLICGVLTGVLGYLIHLYVPSYNNTYFIAGSIIFLFFATQSLIYFYLAFLPFALPIIIFQPDINVFLMLLIAIPLYNLQKMLNFLQKKHRILAQKKQRQETFKNYIINNLKVKVEKDLKQIEECEHVISMNSKLLEKQKLILEMTNTLTPVKTWEWNIKEGIFKILNGSEVIMRNDSIMEKYLTDIVHPNDINHLLNTLRNHFLNEKGLFRCEYRRMDTQIKDWIWVISIGRVIQSDPNTNEPTYMVGVVQDIEQQKQAQGRIDQSSNIFEHIEVGIVTFDTELKYVDANPFFYTMIGLNKEQILGKKLFEIADNYRPQQRSLHFSITDQIFKKSYFTGEFEEQFTNGKTVHIRCHINAIKDNKNNITQYVGIFSDLTHYRKQEKRLSYLENHDIITNLPNRFAYNYKTYQFFITHGDSIHQIAIIRIGIDRFSALNAFLGSQSTSNLLKQVAQRLRIYNPNAFIIAYLNREDFVIVYELNHIQPSIQALCNQLLNSFKTPFALDDQELILSLSIGVAIYPDHSQNFETLNKQAQQALAHAQHLGGNTVQYYSIEQESITSDLQLETELHQALKNEELELYYQPKINTNTNTIFGFEALIRWNHPTKGLMFPDQFLPVAQQTSIISEIGQYVLERAIIQLKKWHELDIPPVQMSVNIDAQQLYRGQLVNHLDHLLAKHKVKGQYLTLEMTESSLIENTDYVQRLLHQIKVRKIKLSLDDFGKGYSSLAYLTNFPFDVLKIDKQFVHNLDNPKKNAILSAIIAMGQAMNLNIIAEGVETTEQLEYLQSKHCHIIQGYLFSKPLSVQNATQFIQNFS